MQPDLYPFADDVRAYRRCVCGRDSIYYRVENDIVEITRILGWQDEQTSLQ